MNAPAHANVTQAVPFCRVSNIQTSVRYWVDALKRPPLITRDKRRSVSRVPGGISPTPWRLLRLHLSGTVSGAIRRDSVEWAATRD